MVVDDLQITIFLKLIICATIKLLGPYQRGQPKIREADLTYTNEPFRLHDIAFKVSTSLQCPLAITYMKV